MMSSSRLGGLHCSPKTDGDELPYWKLEMLFRFASDRYKFEEVDASPVSVCQECMQPCLKEFSFMFPQSDHRAGYCCNRCWGSYLVSRQVQNKIKKAK